MPVPIDKSELRRLMGHFATGVTVITTRDAEGRHFGLTANAFTSVSLVPPLILVCVDKGADCYRCFEESQAFVVNILSESQEDVSRRFATKGADKFSGIRFRSGGRGCAILDDSAAWLECRVVGGHDGGDHTIYVGEVEGGDAIDARPLLFFRGGYRQLGD